jgi:hypothetical protein
MESFALTKDSNFKDIEEALKVLEKNKALRIRLPNTLQEKGVFGLEGLVCQFIATWLRKNAEENILHTYSNAISPEEFEDLSSNLYGVCALRLVDKILTNQKAVVPSNVALQYAFDRIRKVIKGNYKDAYKGMYVAIPSIKSLGVNREYNNPFYNQEKVIGKEGFRKLLDEVMAVVIPATQRNAHIESMKGNISEIVRELFDNTHKHGRENELGDILSTNFRAVVFNSVDVTEKRLNKLVMSGTPGMLGFTGDWVAWMKKHNRKLPVLDVTIVDAGPGYARRWTGKSKNNLSLEDEVLSVIACFKKNNTTSPNSADGSGLTHVLTDLRKLRGWFRLRTGRVAVSRSFFNGSGSVEIESKDINEVGSFVEGVSFNIVIPLVDMTKEGYPDV